MKTVLIALALLACNGFDDPADFESVPAPRWKFKTNGPIFSSPVVSGNIAYIGSIDSVLYAVDISTGELRWKFRINGPIRSTVSIENDHVFLVGGDGVVRCLDKRSGKVVWKFQTQGEKTYPLYGYADYYHSSPALSNGVLYLGSGDGNVYALKASSGEPLWSFRTEGVVHSSPVVHAGKVCIGSFDGHLYALDAQNGSLIWKFKSVGQRFFPRGEMQGSPVVAHGLVYIGSRDYNLYAIDIEKGYCHWNKQFPKGWGMALSVRDSILYVGTSDDDVMIAMDGRTGSELWRTNMQFNIFGTAAFTKSMMYFGTLIGKMHGLDIATGTVRWTFNTDGYNTHHKKYFRSEEDIVKNDFYAVVQTPEGYIDALHKLGAVFSKPALTKNSIIIGSTDGTVYCLVR